MSSYPKKIKDPKQAKFPSELRFDLVSKDWVVIATGRARRPETFKKEERTRKGVSPKECPFCQIQTQEPPTMIISKGKEVPLQNGIPKDWTTIVIPNKFPAFIRDTDLNERAEGPHQLMDALGFHEVVVTRDHEKSMAQFSVEQIKEVIDAYQERYLELMNESRINYVSIFHNHGAEAGASITHPHSQIIAIPITDPDINRSLAGARQFFESQKKCVHCAMTEWDLEDKRRIVFENKEFLVICPFASKAAFELTITPREHLAYFERINAEQKKYLAEAFQIALTKLYKGLNDPPLNFFLHTAPCDGKNYDFYHWHWGILPKTSIWAGFELGVGIEISTIEPEKAAEYLRAQ